MEKRLLVVMSGLPARCKTFIARKLENYFRFCGHEAQVFNVGDHRRKVCRGGCHRLLVRYVRSYRVGVVNRTGGLCCAAV